ncbi:MAG: c-type cytochrome [Terracidiphilus sp.]
MNRYAVWFSRVVWVGIVANCLMAIPTLVMPGPIMMLYALPLASPLMWPSFAALLLLLLSAFYVPAALHPLRYLSFSWLAVLARFAGVVFFCIFNRDYIQFGLFDLTFFIPEVALLILAVREMKAHPHLTKHDRLFRSFRRTRLGLVVVALLIVAFAGLLTYEQFFRQTPPPYFATAEEHFLYGSIGTEGTAGVPYWIWLVLPRVFPDKLPAPGGYASLGIVSQEGHELPVGFSKQRIGIDRVGINCAFCHTATYRKTSADKPTIVAAGPSNTTSPQDYLRFLFACADDPRFNGATIMAEIERNYQLSLLDQLTYRFALIPFTKLTLQYQERALYQYGWMRNLPPWGYGRIDPFNPVKYRVLNQPVDGSIGNSDMMPVWNLASHQGYALHWDGLNTTLQEVLISSAIGDGTPVEWVNTDFKKSDSESSLKRIRDFMLHVQPPPFPFPVDQQLVTKGKVIFDQQCAVCHAAGGARTGQVEPVENPMLNTDRHRIDMWTQASATAYNDYAKGYSWKFSHFDKQNGYVNVSLEGLWLRGPYLHNGSVPTIVDLLKDPADRPKVFYRGYDVLDPDGLGFVSTGDDAMHSGFRYDTQVAGNSNQGHLWGITLSADQKRALLEYLKTM